MKYQLIELIQIVSLVGNGGSYWNTIGVFPSIPVAKAYAETRSVSSLGKVPLYWTDHTIGKTGREWTAYTDAPKRGLASWQIKTVEFEIDEHLLEEHAPMTEEQQPNAPLSAAELARIARKWDALRGELKSRNAPYNFPHPVPLEMSEVEDVDALLATIDGLLSEWERVKRLGGQSDAIRTLLARQEQAEATLMKIWRISARMPPDEGSFGIIGAVKDYFGGRELERRIRADSSGIGEE
jgi:hypothetical protein